MNRKEFFKKACGLGICSCMGLSLLSKCKVTDPETEDNPVNETTDGETADARQIYSLLLFIESSIDEPEKTRIFQELGAAHLSNPEYIAALTQMQNNVGGYFDFINSGQDKYWEKIEYNPVSSTIKITGKPVNKCACAYAQYENPPLSLCNSCCPHYQKTQFELLLQKTVTKVQVDEAFLLGGNRCSTTLYIDGQLQI